MRWSAVGIIVLLAAASSLMVGRPQTSESQWDWDTWRALAVQDNGRQKPLDTLARETLRVVSYRAGFADPTTNKQLDPTALFLAMFFDWRGWDHPQCEQLSAVSNWRPVYFRLHHADQWDEAPLIHLDDAALRTYLGVSEDAKWVTAAQLQRAQVEDLREQRNLTFEVWTRKLVQIQETGMELTRLEKKGLELADRLGAYLDQRMGRSLQLVPIPGSDTSAWMPLGDLMITRFNATTDPSGQLHSVQQLLRQARAAYRANDYLAFNQTADKLVVMLRAVGPALGPYPSSRQMALEVAYNHVAPFRIAWVLLLCALVGMLVDRTTQWRPVYQGAWTAYMGGLVASVAGVSLRIVISGRPPVTNMYESVIYVGTGVALFGLIFELVSRQRFVLTAAAAVSMVAFMLGDSCPTILDPSVRPLEPILRSNFWLMAHVMTITLSYAAFAVALGIANVTLGLLMLRSTNRSTILSLSQATYQAINVGVLLLAAGIVLGAMWADYSWGRFWGWDPKEVWALIALLGYLAALHARDAGWVGHRGLAMLAVACFSLVVMAWYGVNLLVSSGRHSYGFGAGGGRYIVASLALQWLFASLAVALSRENRPIALAVADSHVGAVMSTAQPASAGSSPPVL